MMISTSAQETSDTELLLSIGGVVGRVLISNASASFAADMRRRYAAFSLPCSPTAERSFSLQVTMTSNARLVSSWPMEIIAPEVRTTAAHIDVTRWDFVAHLARSSPNGSFRGRAECHATSYAFESLLRVLWSVLLPRAGGGLFHACGIRAGDCGVLAPGQSGAGKTTLARKVTDPDDVFSDEVVAIHRGTDGGWRMSGTPFFGELQQGARSMRSWPLGGIAFLEKGDSMRVSALPAGDAVLRALECLMCFEEDPETVQRNFALVIELCREVPVFTSTSLVQTPIATLFEAWAPHLRVGHTSAEAVSARELIAALRTNLHTNRSFAFTPRGGSMRPWLQSGDSLFVEAVEESNILPGDVVLYWRVGRAAEHDSLICHRVVGRLPTGRGWRIFAKGDALPQIDSFDDGEQAKVIGRVRAVSRSGQTWEMPGRAVSLAILLSSILLIPLLRFKARRWALK